MSAAAPFDIHGLESWARSEAEDWNAFLAALPDGAVWDRWLAETAAELLSRPAGNRPVLTVSKVIETAEGPVEHVLEGERTVLGREAGCDIVLPEKVITKQHAALALRDGRWFLEDLGSAMGVFRRHKQLEPHAPVELADDDEFSIFPYSFRFRLEELWAAEDDVAPGPAEIRVESWKDFLASAGPDALAFTLRVEPVDEELYVQVDAGLAADLIGGLAPGAGLPPDGAGRLEADRALLEVWLLALLDRLEEKLGGAARLGLSGRIAGEAAWPLLRGACVATSLRIRGRSRGLRFFVPFRTARKLGVGAIPHSAAEERLSLRCRVSIASEQYLVNELAQLEPGDVLLPKPSVLLHLPGRAGGRWRCTALDEGWAGARLEEFSLTELDVSDQGPTADTFGGLPVSLDVVVGEKRLTMAQIRELREGSVIELDRTADSPVELWANGVRAGRGELVEVEGKLGVKVTEWLRK